jgi:CBS domain-containing protein
MSLQGSRSPAALPDTRRARDVMTGRIVHAEPDDTTGRLAELLAGQHIHAIVVFGLQGSRFVWGVVTDIDLLRAVSAGQDALAGELAGTEAVTVDASDPLPAVAQRLLEHDVSHAIVVADERPVGVVSSLDLVGACVP